MEETDQLCVAAVEVALAATTVDGPVTACERYNVE